MHDEMEMRMIKIVETFYKQMKRNRRYCRTVKELSRLSDRELRDIGIHRCDIQRIALDTM